MSTKNNNDGESEWNELGDVIITCGMETPR